MEIETRRPLVPATLAFALGVGAGFFPPWGWWATGVAGFGALGGLWVGLRGTRAGAAVFFAAMVVGGVSLQMVARRALDPEAFCGRGLEGVAGVEMSGRAANLPEVRGGLGGGYEFVFAVAEVRRPGKAWERMAGRVRVVVEGDLASGMGFGRRAKVSGTLRRIATAMNPGQFDPREYWGRRGVGLECRVPCTAVAWETASAAEWVGRAAGWFREYLRAGLCRGIEDDRRISAVIAGMLYGDRSRFDEGLIESFRRTGTVHLFAVSGQNVGVLAAAGILVLRLAGMNRWRHGWTLVPLLGLYTLATGAQPSAVRAFLMASLVLCAWLLDRPVCAVQLLSAAAFGILATAPGQLADAGFQLSFAVVLALVTLTPRLYGWMSAFGAPDPFLPRSLWSGWLAGWDGVRKAVVGTVAASAAAFLGAAPLCAWHFHMVSPASVGVNVVVVPMASLVVVVGALSLTSGALHPLLGELCNNANWMAASVIVWVVTTVGRVPWASFHVGARAGGEVEVVALSVEGGQAVLVRSGGECDLFDCGSGWQGRSIVAPALRYHGVNRIERLWLGHGDAEHIGGAAGILESWRVSGLAVAAAPARSSTLLDLLERHAAAATAVRAGQTMPMGRARWRVLFPTRESAGRLADDRGIVAKLEGDACAVLFLGDAGETVERALLAGGADMRANVLVAGAHATEEGLGREFLEAVRPRHVVFNGGRYRREQLGEAQRRRIEAQGATVWDLSRTGALRIRLGKGGPSVARLRAVRP